MRMAAVLECCKPHHINEKSCAYCKTALKIATKSVNRVLDCWCRSRQADTDTEDDEEEDQEVQQAVEPQVAREELLGCLHVTIPLRLMHTIALSPSTRSDCNGLASLPTHACQIPLHLPRAPP